MVMIRFDCPLIATVGKRYFYIKSKVSPYESEEKNETGNNKVLQIKISTCICKSLSFVGSGCLKADRRRVKSK